MKVRYLVAAGVIAALPMAAARPAMAAGPARAEHVVVVGIPGLQWSDVTPGSELYRVASRGSAGSLVEHATLPLTCPADGWLTLNAGSRAALAHAEKGPCPGLPSVQAGTVTGMAGIEQYNATLSYSPAWGSLSAGLTCTIAAGPGAALATADANGRVGRSGSGANGQVSGYVPAAGDLTAADLARCPLTVADLGALPTGPSWSRAARLAAADAELARLDALLPPDTTLLVFSPGSLAKAQLGVVMLAGAGFGPGLLHAPSTRQPGLAVSTDLTPAVRGLLGQQSGTVLTSGSRASLPSAIAGFIATSTAEHVWTSTHSLFFWTYALADAVALIGIGLLYLGSAEARRRRRAVLWRAAGVFAAAMPAGTFLADLVPWARQAHPALWLYGSAIAFGIVLGVAALGAARRFLRSDPLAPLGLVCLFTVLLLGIDVMTGSRLQMQTPFGLSVLEAGRFYGIGNEALGIYGIAALGGAGWLSLRFAPDRRRALLAVLVVGVFAVFASGWPGFGGKAGGTIALVPCFLVLGYAVAGWRFTWRRVLLIAVSGLLLLAVFGLVNYLVPATGSSDIGSFTGGVVHGHGSSGDLLLRKIHSNIGSLWVSAFSPLLPVVLVVAGLMLWRPAWFRLKLPGRAFAELSFLRVLLGGMWLMALLGWFANDSGIIVPAAAMPFALPLAIAMMAAVTLRPGSGPVAAEDAGARYLGTARSATAAGQTD